MTLSVQSTVDTASLTTIRSSHSHSQWASMFIERIYQMCSAAHPGMAIDTDAVVHIKNVINRIVLEILEQRPSTVLQMDKIATQAFPKSCLWILQEAWEHVASWQGSRRFGSSRLGALSRPRGQNELLAGMIAVIREQSGVEGVRKDREKQKEVDRMAVYLIQVSESIADDILKWTGNYVKHIRGSEMKISLQNLLIALNADKGLMELTLSMTGDEEEPSPGVLLHTFSNFEQEEAVPSSSNDTYSSIASDFLRDERLYLRELNTVNVFRRRFEHFLTGEHRHHVRELFGNLADIHELTLKMERTLEDAIEMSDQPQIGSGLWELVEECQFDSYLSYLMRERETEDGREQPLTSVISTTINEILSNKDFTQMFESDDRCDSSLDGPTFHKAVKYVLPHLLHCPILHFFRYMDYIKRILDLDTVGELDRTDLVNCQSNLARIQKTLEVHCNQHQHLRTARHNELVARQDSRISIISRLQEIQKNIDNFEGNPIGKTCSELVHEGDLQMVRPSVNLATDFRKGGKWATERHIFLFDQLVLLCKKHKAYRLKDRIAIQTLDIQEVEECFLPHSFKLEQKDKSGVTNEWLMVCRSPDEKNDWMSKLVLVSTRSLFDRILDGYEKEEKKRIPLVVPTAEQYRFAEPDTEDNITFEDYTSSSGIPVVRTATVVKLVERLTYHSYHDNKFVQTFLISFRSFCTPKDLLDMLVERFLVPIPFKLQQPHEMRGGPLAGRYDTIQSHGLNTHVVPTFHEQSYQRFRKEYERPIQRRVLSVMHQWVKNHWYDFDHDEALMDALTSFLWQSIDSGRLTNQHKKFCKSVLGVIEKRCAQVEKQDGHVNPAFDFDKVSVAETSNGGGGGYQPPKPDTAWHAAKKGDTSTYDLLTLHPLEIGRQLTLLHFDLYRAIKPIELVEAAWTKDDKHRRSPQLLKLTDHSNKLTYWLERSIVETDSLEERVAMLIRILEVMTVFEQLHNFTGIVAFNAAIHSSPIHRLTWCWERLDSERMKVVEKFERLCEPRYKEMNEALKRVNPPCVPFSGSYMTNIFMFETGNKTFVKSKPQNGKPSRAELVSFMKCRRISDNIREIQMYQNQSYNLHIEPTMRQFFESINPKGDFDDGDRLESYLYERSCQIQPKDADKPIEVKPNRPAAVLKSPGIKPTAQIKSPSIKSKPNHYSASVTSPRLEDDSRNGVKSPPVHKKSMISPAMSPDVFMKKPMALPTDGSSTMTLEAPPVHPRRRPPNLNTQVEFSPLTGLSIPPPVRGPLGATLPPPPPLHPRGMKSPPYSARQSPTTLKSPHVRSPHASSSTTRHDASPTFVFPDMAPSPPPTLPPKRSGNSGNHTPTSVLSGQATPTELAPAPSNELRVDFNRSGSSEASSPTVKLSVPLPPPALPPRGLPLCPPPIPPKTRNSTSPQLSPPLVDGPAPPLPPKTYKKRKPVV